MTMGRFLTTRSSQWLPGAALLGVAAGTAAALGLSLGLRHWAVYLGLFLALLLLYGRGEAALVRLRERRPPPPRPRARLKLIQGGRNEFDLESEETTGGQKYLM